MSVLFPRRPSSFFVTVALLLITSSTSLALLPLQPKKATAVIRSPHPSTVLLRSTSPSSSDKNKSGSESSSSNLPFSLQDVNLDSLQQYLPNFSNLWDSRESVWRNIVDGDLGRRGEVYTAAQLLVLACIAIGGIPFIGGLLSLVCGPILLLLGVSVLAAGATELGASFSPWPMPSKETKMITQTGLFGQVRHPNYAGLLAACVGFAVVTNDANRLLLTAVLWYILEIKTDIEEKELRAIFPNDYDQYKEKVTGKFFPNQLLDQLPWSVGNSNSKMD